MSVSLQDTPVFASSTPDLAQGNAKPEDKTSRSMPAALSPNGASTANVSFHSHNHQLGPVFGNHPPAMDRHHHAGQPHHGAPVSPSFMHQLKHLLAHFFGGHRPDTSIGNPYRTAPGRPDAQYSLKTPAELIRQLRESFSAFQDPRFPGRVSGASIYAMANKGSSPDRATNDNIRLANELLRRPDLMKVLDRQGSGGRLDGLISRQDLASVINGNNPFKYTTDKQLIREMLNHFNELNGGRSGQSLSFADLTLLAARSVTGNTAQDHLTQLAQEVLKRRDVLSVMDNLHSRDNDGQISLAALLRLSR